MVFVNFHATFQDFKSIKINILNDGKHCEEFQTVLSNFYRFGNGNLVFSHTDFNFVSNINIHDEWSSLCVHRKVFGQILFFDELSKNKDSMENKENIPSLIVFKKDLFCSENLTCSNHEESNIGDVSCKINTFLKNILLQLNAKLISFCALEKQLSKTLTSTNSRTIESVAELKNAWSQIPLLKTDLDKTSMIGDTEFTSSMVNSKSKRRQLFGRFLKYLSELHILCDSLIEAHNTLLRAIDLLKLCSDNLWLNSCYETLAAISSLVYVNLSPIPSHTTLKMCTCYNYKKYDSITSTSDNVINESMICDRLLMNDESGANKLKTILNAEYDSHYLSVLHQLQAELLSEEKLINKFRQVIVGYSKYEEAALLEFEASLRCIEILMRMKQRKLIVVEFLQNVLYIKLDGLSDISIVSRHLKMVNIYEVLGFRRKALFHVRQSAFSLNPITFSHIRLNLLLKAVNEYFSFENEEDKLLNSSWTHLTDGEFKDWPSIGQQLLMETIEQCKISILSTSTPTTANTNIQTIANLFMLYLNSKDVRCDAEKSSMIYTKFENLMVNVTEKLGENSVLVIPPVIYLHNIPQILNIEIHPSSKTFSITRRTSILTTTTISDEQKFKSPFLYNPNFLPLKSRKENKTKITRCSFHQSHSSQFYWSKGVPLMLRISVVNHLTHPLHIEKIGSELMTSNSSTSSFNSRLVNIESRGESKSNSFNLDFEIIATSESSSSLLLSDLYLPLMGKGLIQAKYSLMNASINCELCMKNGGIMINVCNGSLPRIHVQVDCVPPVFHGETCFIDVSINMSTIGDSSFKSSEEIPRLKYHVTNVKPDTLTSCITFDEEKSQLVIHVDESRDKCLTKELSLELQVSYERDEFVCTSTVNILIEVVGSLKIVWWDVIESDDDDNCFIVADIWNNTHWTVDLRYDNPNRHILIDARETCRIPFTSIKMSSSSHEDHKHFLMSVIRCQVRWKNLSLGVGEYDEIDPKHNNWESSNTCLIFDDKLVVTENMMKILTSQKSVGL